jgi:hypothetical protein
MHATLADLIDFDGGLFRAFCRVVSYNFRALRESVEGVFGAGCNVFGAVDGGIGDEMKGVFGAVGCFDGDGFGGGVNFGDGAMDRSNDILIRNGGQEEERSKGRKAKRGFQHGGTSASTLNMMLQTGNRCSKRVGEV